jgi:UDP-N-acetyl-D-glucosamine/UDP-N-acetyl-D-galactosamine dehydrogenase
MSNMFTSLSQKPTIGIVGLGYVGLPLAVEFGKKMRTLGFDLSVEKVEGYRRNIDYNGELGSHEFEAASQLSFDSNPAVLQEADFIIVAVPTPITSSKQPDLSALIESSKIVGKHMKRGAIIVYESTVFPGATEDVCIPILEEHSSMKWKQDFWVGYSPERINPGDKERTVTNITKVVSGDTEATLDQIADLYERIIAAGVYKASSIKVAEASKVIENIQRDLNIALINELAMIFKLVGIDTLEVLEAAGTKWNFLPFRPGLVGGHCIGVDPYYLTYKAETLGYHPEIILSGRRINDSVAAYVAQQTIKQIIKNGTAIKDATIILLGITFKENCADLRNSKVIDLVRELQDYGCHVYTHDPIANKEAAMREYGITLNKWDELPRNVDAIVAAVPHAEYLDMGEKGILGGLKSGGVFIDIKSSYSPKAIKSAGAFLWRL